MQQQKTNTIINSFCIHFKFIMIRNFNLKTNRIIKRYVIYVHSRTDFKIYFLLNVFSQYLIFYKILTLLSEIICGFFTISANCQYIHNWNNLLFYAPSFLSPSPISPIKTSAHTWFSIPQSLDQSASIRTNQLQFGTLDNILCTTCQAFPPHLCSCILVIQSQFPEAHELCCTGCHSSICTEYPQSVTNEGVRPLHKSMSMSVHYLYLPFPGKFLYYFLTDLLTHYPSQSMNISCSSYRLPSFPPFI